jgi:tetratricopeptide (TPR) repeat protein
MNLKIIISSLTIAIGFLWPIAIHAQKFEFNDNCIKAYQSFMAMKVETGKLYLKNELATNNKNALPLVLINYEDFITLTFNENPSEFKKRKPLLDQRLDLLENTDKNSPYYLFSKGLLRLQWSIIRTKYGEYWDAAWDFRKSYLLFSENKKKFPSFKYNNVFLGTQEALISTIPSGYKWISTILGLKGNMKNGMGMLKNYFMSNEIPFKEESYLYYIYLKNYLENDIDGASSLIASHNLDTKNNMLYLFMAANLALNNKKASITESLILNRNKSKEYMPFPMLDYELADAKMKRLDYTGAIELFQKYLNTSKSDFYIKDACLSIAYCYYLQGDVAKAKAYKQKIKTVGKQEADADKQAQKFSQSGTFPNTELLKARLLNDGGNNNQALTILLAKDVKTLRSESEKLEYYYRLSRVYDDMNNDDKALEFYNYTIKIGSESTDYFAARAALQAGYIFEKKGNKSEALRYFNMVLDMEDHDYKNSLDQRAKASINRVLGK